MPVSKLTSFFAKSSATQLTETPAPPAPALSGPECVEVLEDQHTDASARCSLPCCDVTKPTPVRLSVPKEAACRQYGKRKRYFQNEWLRKYGWLVLCHTTTKAFCQTCRYVLNSNIQPPQKNGIECFTKDGFNN